MYVGKNSVEQRKSYRMEHYYFSDKLKCKLDRLRSASIAIVEAPSGYGKTTAIRDYFLKQLPKDTRMYWFTSVEELPASAYKRLCRNIEKIDSDAGERLLKIELPNAATIGDVTDALMSVSCLHETYLVIDDFQLLYNALPDAFFKALFENRSKELHIIFITQVLKKEQFANLIGHEWLHIRTADLKLSAEDIRSYYSLAGVNITAEEAKSIAEYTEGWIIALYLQLCAIKDTGKLYDRAGIMALMEQLYWNKLTEEQRIFLLRLSPFEAITIEQACAVTENSKLPAYAQELLEGPFIRYEPLQGQYELHSILSELLVRKRRECGAEFENVCLLRAGDVCRDEGKIARAMGYYLHAADYQRMLSLDFSFILLEKIDRKPFPEIALDIAQNCPENIKKENVLSMLRVAWALLVSDKKTEFDILMKELKSIVDEKNEDDSPFLLAEWTLLTSFQSYPDLKEMIDYLRKAAELFNGNCSRIILPEMPWWFGEYAPFTAFHISPGEADREADDFEEYISLYSRLTNGHGTGADILFRAQLAFQRGNVQDCEILAHKAVFLSESKKQGIVQLGATLSLAQMALQKSDTEGWQNAINSMERAASYLSQNTIVSRSTLDIVRGILFNELKDQERIAEWLKNSDFLNSMLPKTIINDAIYVYISYLLNKGEITKLIGIIEVLIPKIGVCKPVIHYFLLILSAVCHVFVENHAMAEKQLRQAAEIALPDGMLFALVAYSWILNGLADELIEKEYPMHYEKFKEIKERYGSGWATLYNAINPNEFPSDLTSREFEVACLAAEGLRNCEIAQRLVITESTVRAHLRVVFEKLQIDRRAKLAEKLK